eukprot:GHVO01033907.1.p1 GENE.GHVO01033907.1~~GHVO01033907.1.p1  ORF type:complete len:121 (-),score=10.83 GHVO01033907.1:41-403(-)
MFEPFAHSQSRMRHRNLVPFGILQKLHVVFGINTNGFQLIFQRNINSRPRGNFLETANIFRGICGQSSSFNNGQCSRHDASIFNQKKKKQTKQKKEKKRRTKRDQVKATSLGWKKGKRKT